MEGSERIAGVEIKNKYLELIRQAGFAEAKVPGDNPLEYREDMLKGSLDRLKMTEEELKETANSILSLKCQLSKRGNGV